MTNSLNIKEKNTRLYIKTTKPEGMNENVTVLYKKIDHMVAIMNEPSTKNNQEIRISKPTLKMIFGGAFDKNSIVFISALRFCVITIIAAIIAAIIAYQFDFARSYWVPLSCVAVMSGATIVATSHRAIQRGFGTIVGILIASFILATQPQGYIIALFILLLTFITELFIVKNYGLAALFFTPNALLMAESTTQGAFSFSYFASARIIDVLIGSVIGLIGVWFVGRRSASSRLTHLVSKTIRSQAQLLLLLFSDQGRGVNVEATSELKKMQTNIITLKTLYTTAAGEIPVNQKALDYYWPVIFSVERLGYLLEACSKVEKRPILSEDKLAQILYVCESMANATERNHYPTIKNVPEIESFPSIRNEIIQLQKYLQI
ncbi:FUSC family protein [Ureibacillus sp. NPDC094379]